MTSIPVTICRFSDNYFKRLYIDKWSWKKEWNLQLFFDFLLHSEMCMKFRTFWKKRRVSYTNYYQNYCIWKICLLKRLKGLASAHHSLIYVLTCSKHCWSHHGTTIFLFLLKRLKGLASAHHSVINMLTGSKHFWSQHGTTIFLIFHEFEISWVGKSLP